MCLFKIDYVVKAQCLIRITIKELLYVTLKSSKIVCIVWDPCHLIKCYAANDCLILRLLF